MFKSIYAASAIAAFSIAIPLSALAESPWPKEANVYFIMPQDGADITGPVRVVMGLQGLGVAPAGTEREMTGHHHILINTPAPSGEDLLNPLPADENHVHFGGGQTETELTLAPGTYTLQLIVGDTNHIPHDPPLVSEIITVTVQ